MSDAKYTLFQDPGVTYPDHDTKLPFADYILQCQSIIRNTRPDIQNNIKAEQIIEANSPFELRPPSSPQKIKTGALLIHGLLDSPFIMRDIGNQLRDQGILVRAVLLPGHGTVPGALLNVRYEDWVRTVNYGIESLAEDVEQLFLVGYSTGGSLALYQALQPSQRQFAGLILLAPALKIRSKLAPFSGIPRLINWAWERAKWVHQAKEDDTVKYQSFPFNAVYEVYKLSQEIKKNKTQLNIPLWTAISEEDATILSEPTIQYFLEQATKNSQLLDYAAHPSKQTDTRITVRSSAIPKWNITSLSHVAIPVAPDNAHYGMQGDYVKASHVQENLSAENKTVYGACNDFQVSLYQLLYRLGITKQKYARISFNSDFDYLMQSMRQFITKI